LRQKRLAVLVLAIAFALVCAGCEKTQTWAFDFTTAENVDDWNPEDIGEGSIELVPGKGLHLYRYSVCSPVAFTGDFTVTVDFSLDTLPDSYAYFELYLADGIYWEPENMIYCGFSNVGAEDADETWWVSDEGAGGTENPIVSMPPGPVPYLDRNGTNTWQLVKTGDWYEIKLNGKRMTKFGSSYCRGDKYYVSLYAESDYGDVYFRNVKVDYKGSMI